jgi:transposase-like protein
MLSRRRNNPAATKFFARVLEINGLPRKIVIDKSGANTAGINAINKMLKGLEPQHWPRAFDEIGNMATTPVRPPRDDLPTCGHRAFRVQRFNKSTPTPKKISW